MSLLLNAPLDTRVFVFIFVVLQYHKLIEIRNGVQINKLVLTVLYDSEGSKYSRDL